MILRPAFLADPALRAVLAALPGTRLVGGCVRDAVLGQESADIDLATPSPPDQVMASLAEAGLRAIPTGLAHGTVTALVDGRGFEITTLRRDVETDGRHAVVSWTDDWREDAARRDFTFNALSMTPDGEVFDPFDGIADLRAGRVRFVGQAAARIAEDRLRALRFFRFWARYGRGAPDAEAVAAIRAAAPELGALSAERVWSELKRILAAVGSADAVALMAELGVLATVLPEGADAARLTALIASGAPPDPLLRLASLFTGDVVALAERLRLSAAERDRLLTWRAAPLLRPADGVAERRRALADFPAEALVGRIWLAGGHDGALIADLLATPRPVFPLEGRDVLALGYPPGRHVGEWLRAVRAWWLDGGCVAGADSCRGELRRRIAAS